MQTFNSVFNSLSSRLHRKKNRTIHWLNHMHALPFQHDIRIVLSANAGDNNKAISQRLGLCEETVGFWRKRWLSGGIEMEKYAGRSKQLREAVSRLLADKSRPGSPGVFTAEQICRLLAVACETPPGHLSHWTQTELVRTAIDRGIVETISAGSVGRFLKSGGI